MVSSFDRIDFSWRISGVINGLLGREGQVTVLSGACLSSIVEIVELNSCR